MPNGNGIVIKGKDLGIIVLFASIIIGSVVDSALTRAKVSEHEAKFNKYPPSILYTNQINMTEDVKEIKEDMKEMLNAVNDFIKTQ